MVVAPDECVTPELVPGMQSWRRPARSVAAATNRRSPPCRRLIRHAGCGCGPSPTATALARRSCCRRGYFSDSRSAFLSCRSLSNEVAPRHSRSHLGLVRVGRYRFGSAPWDGDVGCAADQRGSIRVCRGSRVHRWPQGKVRSRADLHRADRARGEACSEQLLGAQEAAVSPRAIRDEAELGEIRRIHGHEGGQHRADTQTLTLQGKSDWADTTRHHAKRPVGYAFVSRVLGSSPGRLPLRLLTPPAA